MFAKGLATVSVPIQQLLKEDVEFNWPFEQQNSLEQIKSIIISAPVLRYFENSKTTILQRDASQYGLGAYLMQDGYPIACIPCSHIYRTALGPNRKRNEGHCVRS